MNNTFQDLDRRTFLKWGISALATGLVSSPALALVPPLAPKYQVLSFYNIHTKEVLETCYRKNGKLVFYGLKQIDHIMRDHRTREIKPVDPQLLDLLHRIVSVTQPHAPINIISGYRSPRTNAALRKITTGVARKSLHMQGRAIDIRIPGHPTYFLRELAIKLKAGGVGYYPKSDFVHLDTGRVRTW